MSQDDYCFACGRSIRSTLRAAHTIDGQSIYVGSDCYKRISQMGIHGYQPPLGGPRLFTTMEPLCKCDDHWPKGA